MGRADSVLHLGDYFPIFAWCLLQTGPSIVLLGSVVVDPMFICLLVYLLFCKVGYLVQCNVRWDAMSENGTLIPETVELVQSL